MHKTQSHLKSSLLKVVLLSLLFALTPTMVQAEESQPKDKVQLIAQVITKLMAKGDESVIAIGRILKADTYRKKLNNPQRAIEELDKLSTEITDSELLFAVDTIRMLILKETQKDPQKYLASIDRIIANASKRKSQ